MTTQIAPHLQHWSRTDVTNRHLGVLFTYHGTINWNTPLEGLIHHLVNVGLQKKEPKIMDFNI